MTLDDLYRLLRSGHVQAQGVVDTMTQPIVILDHSFSVTTANHAFINAFKVDRDDVLGQSFFDLGNGQWDIAELRNLISSVIPKAAAVIGYEIKHDFPTIGERTFLVDVRRLSHPDANSTNLLVLFEDVTERQRQDVEKDFIISETRHRMRNLFAVVRSVHMQTEISGRTAMEYRDVVLGRMEVTLRAQEVAATHEGSDLEDLLRHSMGGVDFDRLHCDGPAVNLESALIFALSMIFHELSTNALKYGSLSNSHGVVEVKWTLEAGQDGHHQLSCEWREEGGPPVRPPEQSGYGTRLIKGMAAHLGGSVELSYEPAGLIALIQVSV